MKNMQHDLMTVLTTDIFDMSLGGMNKFYSEHRYARVLFDMHHDDDVTDWARALKRKLEGSEQFVCDCVVCRGLYGWMRPGFVWMDARVVYRGWI